MKLHVVVVLLLRHFQATQKAVRGKQPYFDPTRKMTLKKMEDDLQKNGRRPPKKWKTTSIFFLNGQPQKKWKTTSKKMENDLKKIGDKLDLFGKSKTTLIF
jgi:hypothetical protein